MAVKTRVDPIDRDIRLIIDETLSPAGRSKQFADAARAALGEADETNRRVLGRIPPNHTFVDGVEGATLDSVRPDGVIVREYELVADLLVFIGDELRKVSPVQSGRYQASHTLFADGAEVPIGVVVPEAREYVFLSSVPYARKIEGAAGSPPESPQAPKGVYEITATKANSQFGNIARVQFGWRSPFMPYGGAPSQHKKRHGVWSGGREWETRVPAIFVTIGR
ncbi:MAG TPA: hypothetical protein VHZ78_08575 [Rhizomicrobium sp.]|jgi:hypothetical protein|nr:hypothetical protein [Rhizomicrobium sp.]